MAAAVPDGVSGGVAPCVKDDDGEAVVVAEVDGVVDADGVLLGVEDGVGFRQRVPGCCVLSTQLTFIVKL